MNKFSVKKEQLKKPITVGTKIDLILDDYFYTAEIIGVDYLTKVITLKVDWEVDVNKSTEGTLSIIVEE